jgi:hypothetical protein
LLNTANPDISYELLVSVCIKGIISIEVKDVKEDFKRFKLSKSGIMSEYQSQFIDYHINKIDIAESDDFVSV